MPEDDRLVRAAEAVVAGLRGHVGPVVDPVAGVQVRAADAAARHLDADLAAAGVGLRALLDLELGVLADDGLHATRGGGEHAREPTPPFRVRAVSGPRCEIEAAARCEISRSGRPGTAQASESAASESRPAS